MICAKCGGLASSNAIFTVGCSIVEVAFEFMILTDDGDEERQMKATVHVPSTVCFHEKCRLLEWPCYYEC